MIAKLISGGQTGVDRAALDVALELGIATGGWVPLGRLAEDGPLPSRYSTLMECESQDPALRTRLNVRDAGATLLVTLGRIRGGTALTLEVATELERPLLHCDLSGSSTEGAARDVADWLLEVKPGVLNVAGPRASEEPEVYAASRELLRVALLTPIALP